MSCFANEHWVKVLISAILQQNFNKFVWIGGHSVAKLKCTYLLLGLGGFLGGIFF